MVHTRPGAKASWMSLLPSEIESQVIGLDAAYGHTVVFGLGMGWLAANAALRPAVERVTVVERDADVIGLVEDTGVFAQLPAAARDKLVIVHEDALQWRPTSAVDTLQADIWLHVTEDGKVDEVRRMHANVAPTWIYFWGQEMEIWRCACQRAGGIPDSLEWATVRAIVAEDLALPLVLPEWPEYPRRIAAAAPWWTPRAGTWWQPRSGAPSA